MTGEHTDRKPSTSVHRLYRQARNRGFFIREFRGGTGLFVAAVGDKTTLQELGIRSTTRLKGIPSPSAVASSNTRTDAVRQALDAWIKTKAESVSTED